MAMRAPTPLSALGPAQLRTYHAEKASVGTAYVLWFFFGGAGGHRFYAGQKNSGMLLAGITLGSFILSFALIGFFTIWISIIWTVVDAFLIPGMILEHNELLAKRLAIETAEIRAINAMPDLR